MRTTLSIDDDVAAKLKKLSADRSFKCVVNEALRAGLHALESQAQESQGIYSTTPVSGNPRLHNLDNVAKVVEESEGEHWR